MEYRILFLDDEEPAHKSFDFEIKKLFPNIVIEHCYNRQEVESALKKNKYDIFFLDQRLKDGQLGTEVAKTIRGLQSNSYIVMATAFGLESAEEAIRARVFSDFVSKSENDEFKALELVFNRFEAFRKQEIEISNLKNENTQLKNELKQKNILLANFDKTVGISVSADNRFESLERNIIGESNEIIRVKYFIQKYADTDDNVLIIGETGTGKDLIAEAIHKLSKRKNKIFKTVNCAAIPEELIEPTLFGVISKYPGFHNEKPLIGIFEEAHEGTVFLDEIDRMSLRGQSKLLRLLEDQKVIKLGETDKEGKKVDVRIIAAIKPLALDKIGITFLEDLYGRLQSLFPIIPLLSKRKEDIPLLVSHFIDLIGYNYLLIKKGSDNGKLQEKQYPYSKYLDEFKGNKIFVFDEEGMNLIKNFVWNRNVRELRKFIENIFSIFVKNKNSFSNQIIPVEDVRTAFIFHNAGKNITADDQKLLNEKYSINKSLTSTRKINLNEAKYKKALDVIKMLNNACSKVIESANDKNIAIERIEEVGNNIKNSKLNQIKKYIDEGNFDNLAVIGLFCKNKSGKEGMAFEAIYDYFTQEFFDLYDSKSTDVLSVLGDLSPLREKLDFTLQNQKAKKISNK